MAINSIWRSSPTRIMGLSSGLDTESIIQQTMKVHQMRIDTQMRQKTLLQWKQETHTGIKDQITSFRNTFLSSLGSSTLMQKSVYNSTVANLTGKNSDAVSIKTSIGSTTGTMRIGKILSLAKGASVSSASGVSMDNAGFSTTTKLEDLKLINGPISFDSLGNADIFIEYNDNGTPKSETITLNKNDSINDMINKVNKSAAGVTMKYDRLADQFTIESKTTGSGSFNVSGGALEALGFAGADSTNGIDATGGSKAQVYINGNLETFDSNTFSFRGLTITLNRETTTGATGSTQHDDDTIVTLKRDATEAVNRIKSFVDAYNSIIKKIEGLVKERKTTSEAAYGPLTDEEKSAMSEKQIAEWEAIAKKGILKNDAGLQKLASSLRSALFESVQSAGLSPADIGLSTGSFFGGTGGQIVLDEEKLRAALEEDPDKVSEIFSGTDGNRGFLWRVNNIMGDYVNKDQTMTMKSLENSIKRANDQMAKMQERMYEAEDKLYRQFAAMESALSKIQSQGDWMSAMLGGGK